MSILPSFFGGKKELALEFELKALCLLGSISPQPFLLKLFFEESGIFAEACIYFLYNALFLFFFFFSVMGS
jgi:hypothetical protein